MDVQAELDELCFNVARSIRYHDKRREFFELMQKLATWISLVASSAAVVLIIKEFEGLALALAALVALISAATVGFEFSSKLALYTDLRGRFLDLESLLAACRHATEDDIVRLTQIRKGIERGEPSVSKSLNLICYNDTIDALGGDPSQKVEISRFDQLRAYTYLG